VTELFCGLARVCCTLCAPALPLALCAGAAEPQPRLDALHLCRVRLIHLCERRRPRSRRDKAKASPQNESL